MQINDLDAFFNQKNMKNTGFRILVLLISLFVGQDGFAQNLDRIKSVIDTLCSPSYNGRGYVSGGDFVAANFIERQYNQIGLKAFNNGFRQRFSFDVNTFEGKAECMIARKKLNLSDDFLPDPACKTIRGKFKVFFLDSTWLRPSGKQIQKLYAVPMPKTALVLPIGLGLEQLSKSWPADLMNHAANAALKILQTKNRPAGSLSHKQQDAILHIRSGFLNNRTKKIRVNIQSKFIENYNTQNLIGWLPGTTKPDSFIVFCAHYDHLGSIGNAVFAGANDNASGIAIMLETARHYADTKNRSPYSIAFIAFAGEEIGLRGSEFYCKNPLFALSKIRFLTNLDLMGSGESGLTVVNATACPSEFKILQQLNTNKNYFGSLQPRAPAANSDHYHFAENSVPAFFFYLRGRATAYHDIHDLPATLTLFGAIPLLHLMYDFVDIISHKNKK